jgi:hypothetical protein
MRASMVPPRRLRQAGPANATTPEATRGRPASAPMAKASMPAAGTSVETVSCGRSRATRISATSVVWSRPTRWPAISAPPGKVRRRSSSSSISSSAATIRRGAQAKPVARERPLFSDTMEGTAPATRPANAAASSESGVVVMGGSYGCERMVRNVGAPLGAVTCPNG